MGGRIERLGNESRLEWALGPVWMGILRVGRPLLFRSSQCQRSWSPFPATQMSPRVVWCVLAVVNEVGERSEEQRAAGGEMVEGKERSTVKRRQVREVFDESMPLNLPPASQPQPYSPAARLSLLSTIPSQRFLRYDGESLCALLGSVRRTRVQALRLTALLARPYEGTVASPSHDGSWISSAALQLTGTL